LWPKEEKGQIIQWLKEEKGQTIQWLKEGQTTQWPKEKGQKGNDLQSIHIKLKIE
jgi:hypothetical protein